MNKLDDVDDPALRLSLEILKGRAERHRLRRAATSMDAAAERTQLDVEHDAMIDYEAHVDGLAFLVEQTIDAGETVDFERPPLFEQRFEEIRTAYLAGRSPEEAAYIFEIPLEEVLVRVLEREQERRRRMPRPGD